MVRRRTEARPSVRFPDPPMVRAVLADARFAWLWPIPRVYLGWLWLEAGWQRGHASLAEPMAIGQTLAGIALILGALTGLAAFAGGVLDAAGVASGDGPPPLLFALAVALVLAWKSAGWIGLDRWLLPLLGMPWRGGALFRGGRTGTHGEDGPR